MKTVAGLILLLEYIVIIIVVIALIYLVSQNQPLIGFLALVVGVVIALLLLAYSKLTYVFIDIEYNTRKTGRLLKEIATDMTRCRQKSIHITATLPKAGRTWIIEHFYIINISCSLTVLCFEISHYTKHQTVIYKKNCKTNKEFQQSRVLL